MLEGLVSFAILMLIDRRRHPPVQRRALYLSGAVGDRAWRSTTASPAAFISTRSPSRLTEILGGFVIGSACGILLGIAMVQIPVLDRFVYPYVVALQTVPKVAIAPLMIVWFGFGISSKIIIVALTCLFPSLVNTIAGLRAVDSDRIALIKAMCGSRAQLLRYVQPAERAALHHGRASTPASCWR